MGGPYCSSSAEELNITTVFRLLLSYLELYFCLMVLAGFDVFTIVTTSLLGLYQLFTHSRIVGKLGILEYFMTTPSHHRYIMGEMKIHG